MKETNNRYQDPEQGLRIRRILMIAGIVILCTLAIVLAVTAATNRARKKKAQQDSPLTTPDTTQEQPKTQEPATTQKPVEKEPEKPIETVPTLSLPVQGSLSQIHSVDTQVFSTTMQDWRVHLGIDLTTEQDAPVYAAADGTVARVWEDPMMGQCVALRHSGDCLTVYKNLSPTLADGIRTGATVARGQILGTVGDSAMVEIAEEPHLHMEMTVKGIQVDPLEYFSSAVLASITEDTSFEQSAGDVK